MWTTASSNNGTLSTFLYCSVHYTFIIYDRWKKTFHLAKVRSGYVHSINIQQHIKLWTVSTPFGGCYYAIELTLLIKMLNLDHINTRTSFEEMRPDIQSINENLRYTFLSGNQTNIKWRKRQFDKVKKFLLENQKEIIDCVVADFGRFCRTNCTKYVWNI